MASFTIIAALSVVFLLLNSANASGTSKLPECAYCSSNNQCSTWKCWNGRCIRRWKFQEESKKKCFAPECSTCSENSDCITQLCLNKKCVAGYGWVFRRRCLRKGPCAPCWRDAQCQSNICFGRKCIADYTDEAKAECGFQEDCEECDSKFDCLSLTCRKNKCGKTPWKCARKSPECDYCKYNSDCESNLCFANKCVYPNDISKIKCGLKPNCETCHKNFDCVSLNCYQNRCVPFGDKSLKECLKDDCDDCKHKSECKSNICARKKCLPTRRKDWYTCFLKDECEYCSRGRQCKSGICRYSYCVNDYSPDAHEKCRSPDPTPTISAKPSESSSGAPSVAPSMSVSASPAPSQTSSPVPSVTPSSSVSSSPSKAKCSNPCPNCFIHDAYCNCIPDPYKDDTCNPCLAVNGKTGDDFCQTVGGLPSYYKCCPPKSKCKAVTVTYRTGLSPKERDVSLICSSRCGKCEGKRAKTCSLFGALTLGNDGDDRTDDVFETCPDVKLTTA